MLNFRQIDDEMLFGLFWGCTNHWIRLNVICFNLCFHYLIVIYDLWFFFFLSHVTCCIDKTNYCVKKTISIPLNIISCCNEKWSQKVVKFHFMFYVSALTLSHSLSLCFSWWSFCRFVLRTGFCCFHMLVLYEISRHYLHILFLFVMYLFFFF